MKPGWRRFRLAWRARLRRAMTLHAVAIAVVRLEQSLRPAATNKRWQARQSHWALAMRSIY